MRHDRSIRWNFTQIFKISRGCSVFCGLFATARDWQIICNLSCLSIPYMASHGILGNAGKMEKSACIFGPAFRDERLKRGISLWKIVHETCGYLATLQRMEKGITQPRLQNALQLLSFIGANSAEFLAEITIKFPEEFPAALPQPQTAFAEFELPAVGKDCKLIYGNLLAQARRGVSISQAEMAKRARYNLRNINAVENGKQEPGIITAISLVMATGFDVRLFFSQLIELYHAQ